MLVVADATPLHYLVLIGEIDLLRKLYGTILVPTAVIQELSASQTPIEVRSWIAALPSFFTVADPFDSAKSLPFPKLGLGEREAIALSLPPKNSILLTDDLQARLAAESVGIQTVPTIRILSTASDLSLVNLNDALARLQATNFRVSTRLVDRILKGQSLN